MNNFTIPAILALASATLAFSAPHTITKARAQKITPIVEIENLRLTDQSIQSSSASVLISDENLLFMGQYKQHDFGDPMEHDLPTRYYSIDTLLEVKQEKNQYIGIFKSDSDRPISGGSHTIQAGVAYGREIKKKPDMSLVLGGGLAFGELGATDPHDSGNKVIPVPLIRLNYHPDWIQAQFDFLTSPNLNFSLEPKDRFRLSGDLRMDQFRDDRDLLYKFLLEYELPYDQPTKYRPSRLSLGFKNDTYGEFKLGNSREDESLEIHYQALFVAIDISIIRLTAGYAFHGRSLYRESEERDLGEGSYLSIHGTYSF